MKVPVNCPSRVTGMSTVCPASRASDCAGLGRNVVSPSASTPSRLTTTTDLKARELVTWWRSWELSGPMSPTVNVSTMVSATPMRERITSAYRELTPVSRRSSDCAPAEFASRATAIRKQHDGHGGTHRHYPCDAPAHAAREGGPTHSTGFLHVISSMYPYDRTLIVRCVH